MARIPSAHGRNFFFHVPPITAITLLVLFAGVSRVSAQTTVTPEMTLEGPAIDDQDDMCFWIHPTNRSLSTIVTSDKAAGRLFVYDLSGYTLQTITVAGQPGNIDIRYDFPLGSERIDIVAINNRNTSKLEIYRVSAQTRQLTRIDNDAIQTGGNYGVCLYRSGSTYYAFVTSENGVIKQFELRTVSGDRIGAVQVRSWDAGGITEGCVCDDETGQAYFGEENQGIWKVGASPSAPTPGTLVSTVGDGSGLEADVEGLTIYYAAGGGGYLIASSQGSNDFKIYDRRPPHAYLRTIAIAGVSSSDGIDVTNVNLGSAFPKGAFAAHNDGPTPKTVEVCAYEDLGLLVDTGYWDPRAGSSPVAVTPEDGRLGLQVSGPGPSPVISFTLPESRSGALEIFDVAGRRLWALRTDGLGAGVHRVDVSGHPALRSGVYLIRLTHGATALKRRLFVTR
jgi:3-phytase